MLKSRGPTFSAGNSNKVAKFNNFSSQLEMHQKIPELKCQLFLHTAFDPNNQN